MILFLAAGLHYDGHVALAAITLLALAFPIHRLLLKKRNRISLKNGALEIRLADGRKSRFLLESARAWRLRQGYVFDGSYNDNNRNPLLELDFDEALLGIGYATAPDLHLNLMQGLTDRGIPYDSRENVPSSAYYPQGETKVRAFIDRFRADAEAKDFVEIPPELPPSR